eukprot:9188-Heterococcus_DN1.PRE.2
MHMSHKHSEPAELVNNFAKVDFESIERTFDQSHRNRALGATAAAMLPFLINVGEASAKGGELGIWEGRTAALVHPIIMGALFALSGYAALLGLEWRELRTAGGALSALKEQLPVLSTGQKASFPVSKDIAAINGQIAALEEGASSSGLKADLSKLQSAAVIKIDEEFAAITKRRKELSTKNVRDKHYEMGSLILGLGVFAAIEGPANTYVRAGKMQKGNEAARIAHITINFGILGFFGWQVVTGLQIVEKVLEFTKFP